MSSVCQDWVLTLPGKMQSVLVLGLRGPDTQYLPHVKTLGRWLRGLVLIPSDPDNPRFMFSGDPGRIDEKSELAHELEFCTVHYYTHLMHVFQIVAFGHPDQKKREQAQWLYSDMCWLMHLPCETWESFQQRLGHKEWPYGQPRDFDEAERLEKEGPKIVKQVIDTLANKPKRTGGMPRYGASHG